jgi:hypothetical protein
VPPKLCIPWSRFFALLGLGAVTLVVVVVPAGVWAVKGGLRRMHTLSGHLPRPGQPRR